MSKMLFKVPPNWEVDWEERHLVTVCFNGHLFDLIQHADSFNREKIRQGFPAQVAVVEAWEKSYPKEFPKEVFVEW